jgi:hypothetical protein
MATVQLDKDVSLELQDGESVIYAAKVRRVDSAFKQPMVAFAITDRRIVEVPYKEGEVASAAYDDLSGLGPHPDTIWKKPDTGYMTNSTMADFEIRHKDGKKKKYQYGVIIGSKELALRNAGQIPPDWQGLLQDTLKKVAAKAKHATVRNNLVALVDYGMYAAKRDKEEGAEWRTQAASGEGAPQAVWGSGESESQAGTQGTGGGAPKTLLNPNVCAVIGAVVLGLIGLMFGIITLIIGVVGGFFLGKFLGKKFLQK